MVYVAVNTNMDTVTFFYTSSDPAQDSTTNDYFELINDILVGRGLSGDFGSDAAWTGVTSGVDVRTTFPATPSDFVGPFRRVNTNAGSDIMRDWSYNGESAVWEFIEYS